MKWQEERSGGTDGVVEGENLDKEKDETREKKKDSESTRGKLRKKRRVRALERPQRGAGEKNSHDG